MKVSGNGNSGDFESPEPGSYAATCYGVIDIGTQHDEYQGKANNRRQVILRWELEQFMSDGRPFSVLAYYTASLNEKANLRKHLEAWRGEAFKPEQIKDGFDLRKLLGAPCMLSIIKTDTGKTKVGAVLKLPKTMPKPEKHNAPVYFSLDEFSEEAWAVQPEWLQKKIAQSPEYQKLFSAPGHAGGEKHGAPGAAPESDDIPF